MCTAVYFHMGLYESIPVCTDWLVVHISDEQL